MKPRLQTIIILAISFICLGILSIYFIPNFWFQRHLTKNWNIPESGIGTAESPRPSNRLCLIFALDGVPFDIMDELYADNRRIDLVTALENGGFRDASELITPTDFVLPRNGFVSMPVKAFNRPQTVANLLASAAEAKQKGEKLRPFN